MKKILLSITLLVLLLSIIVLAENINQTNETLQINLTSENETALNKSIEEPESSLIKTLLNLVADKLSTIKGEIINIRASLFYENNTPLSNKTIDFFADELPIGAEITDESGIAGIDWDTTDISAGNYTLKANYSGSDVLQGSSDSIEIEIKEAVINKSHSEDKLDCLPHRFYLDLKIDGDSFSDIKDKYELDYDIKSNSNIKLTARYCTEDIVDENSILLRAELTDKDGNILLEDEALKNPDGKLSLNLDLPQEIESKTFNVGLLLSWEDINGVISSFARNVIIEVENPEKKKHLAKLYNEDNLPFDKEYAKKYLEQYDNFSDISYDSKKEKKMKIGAKNDNIKGFDIDGKKFAVHLIYCNRNSKSCSFRVNGVPTGKIHVKDKPNKKTDFSLTNDYILKINSIEFDYCDGRRFCNVFHEAYDIVDVQIERQS